MKFMAGENWRNPEKITQAAFRLPHNPLGVTETRTLDPSGRSECLTAYVNGAASLMRICIKLLTWAARQVN